MAEPSLQGAAEMFDPLRPRLMRVAYRMLGSVSDAEDVVQEAFIRWMGVASEEIREPEAFLRRVVTRLCLDQLKSAKLQRETYIGPWLPDPIVEEEEGEDVTLPLMLAMERLSPLERAAFLLHDVFGLGWERKSVSFGCAPLGPFPCWPLTPVDLTAKRPEQFRGNSAISRRLTLFKSAIAHGIVPRMDFGRLIRVRAYRDDPEATNVVQVHGFERLDLASHRLVALLSAIFECRSAEHQRLAEEAREFASRAPAR
jgi:DNA-directed RNA polymerase specialized sigma24 family protein